MDEFSGRVAIVATMHRKEQAIASVLEAALGVKAVTPQNFNTDRFGTFTRDVPRPSDQLATARLKAEAALELTGETLAIASEGSFGPHPDMPFLPCDRELVVLVDREHQLELVGQAVSSDTNYRAQSVRTVDEALAFAQAVGFPSHGLVIMPIASDQPSTAIAKGITQKSALEEALAVAFSQSSTGQVHIETDMRALYNPTRMEIIAQAAHDLVRTLNHRCPACHCPGFTAVERYPGLPCSLCHTPTLLTLSLLYRCQRCQFQQNKQFPDGQSSADPSVCPYCNP